LPVSRRQLKKGLVCFDKLSTDGRNVDLAIPAPFTPSQSKGGTDFFRTLLEAKA